MTPKFSATCCSASDHRASEKWRSVVISIAVWPIGLYRSFVSPLKRVPSCRYLPTCSEYAEVAIRQRGVVMGTLLAMWRILRCNPLCRGGYDPVPSSGEKVHAGPR